jgi:hypothetical protein
VIPLNVVRRMIELGFDLNSISVNGDTAVLIAAGLGRVEEIFLVVAKRRSHLLVLLLKQRKWK